ncbi:MAG: cbb3-type cytochrome oxidase subunit 3 [Rhodoferax sp.]
MDITTLRIAVTLVSLAIFIGVVLWAWSAKREKEFSEAARLPFEQD